MTQCVRWERNKRQRRCQFSESGKRGDSGRKLGSESGTRMELSRQFVIQDWARRLSGEKKEGPRCNREPDVARI